MELSEIRVCIDEIDNKFVELFKERMALSKEVALAKMAEGGNVNRPGREKEIVDRLTQNADEEISGYIEELYAKIFEMSKDYQKKIIDKEMK